MGSTRNWLVSRAISASTGPRPGSTDGVDVWPGELLVGATVVDRDVEGNVEGDVGGEVGVDEDVLGRDEVEVEGRDGSDELVGPGTRGAMVVDVSTGATIGTGLGSDSSGGNGVDRSTGSEDESAEVIDIVDSRSTVASPEATIEVVEVGCVVGASDADADADGPGGEAAEGPTVAPGATAIEDVGPTELGTSGP